jgi:hypothetical protein
MRLLVPGCTPTLQRLARTPAGRKHLGHLIQPRARNRPAELLASGLPLALDNDGFNGFHWPRFRAMLDTWLPEGPLFVTMPDVVGNAHATVGMGELYERLLGWSGIDTAEGETPWALVLQDGMEDLDCDYWLAQHSALFIGGSTRWKLSRACYDLVQHGRQLGKWVHMGRVNSFRRLRTAFEWGCDSVDGTGFTQAPDVLVPRFLRWLLALEGLAAQPRLAFEELAAV